ncbi:hypothetical protein FOZ62_027022, partial [Perkinsus olseni]
AQQPRNKGKGKSTKGVGYYKGGSKGQGQAKGKSYSKGSKGGKGYKRPYDATFDSYPRKGKYPRVVQCWTCKGYGHTYHVCPNQTQVAERSSNVDATTANDTQVNE